MILTHVGKVSIVGAERKYPDAMSGDDASDSQISQSHPLLGRMYEVHR